VSGSPGPGLQLVIPAYTCCEEGGQPQSAKSCMEGGFSLLFRDRWETEGINQDPKT